LVELPPSAPSVYNPVEGNYSGDIVINYTQSYSPVGYPIAYYNISLVDLNQTFVQAIASNNSLNLSYVWSSVGVADGDYYIRVEVCDNQNLCSYGFSEMITVDNYEVLNFSSLDSSGNPINLTCVLINSSGVTVYNQTGESHLNNFYSGFYTIILEPVNGTFERLKFEGINFTGDLSQLINFEDNLTLFPYNKIVSYNQLLSNLSFVENVTNLTITLTASNISQNKILYKCADWNWTNQNCTGSWVPLMGIIPGEEYEVFIENLSDPGLAEGNGTFFEGFEGTQSDNQSNVGYDNSGWLIVNGGTWNPNDKNEFVGADALSVKNTLAFSWAEINISTENYDQVVLSLYYKDSNNLEAGEYLTVDWYNGTDWINELNVSNVATYTSFNKTLTDASGKADFKLRLGCNVDATSEYCYWDNINLTGVELPNTCTYSSGNWDIDCSDNCVISSNVDLLGNNISIVGLGSFTTTANITNFTDLYIEGVSLANRCEVYCLNGGCFK
jgi:hypothetical protein